MSEIIMEVDRFTGITETHVKSDDGKMHVKSYQNVDDILSANVAESNSKIDQGWGGDGFHKVASIPNVVVVEWTNELSRMGANNKDPFAGENRAFLKAKLNDPNWRYLRTKEGRI